KLLKDVGDKLPADKKSKAEAAIADAKKDLESADTERMKGALEKLQKLGADFYAEAQQAAEAAGAGAAGAGTPGAGAESGAAQSGPKKAEVVDADFEVVDDEKKK